MLGSFFLGLVVFDIIFGMLRGDIVLVFDLVFGLLGSLSSFCVLEWGRGFGV